MHILDIQKQLTISPYLNLTYKNSLKRIKSHSKHTPIWREQTRCWFGMVTWGGLGLSGAAVSCIAGRRGNWSSSGRRVGDCGWGRDVSYNCSSNRWRSHWSDGHHEIDRVKSRKEGDRQVMAVSMSEKSQNDSFPCDLTGLDWWM